jgi:uncharacterized protein YdeI (BOF family)
MTKMIWGRLPALVCALIIFSSACNGGFPTPIANLLSSPRDYDGKRLTLSGKVVEKNSLLFTKYFVLRDRTGEIHVVTDRVLPNVGATVRVQGHLKEVFSFGQASALVFVEDPQDQ